MSVSLFRLFSTFTFCLVFLVFIPSALAQDVVLYASQAPVKVGNWSAVADSTAAGSFRLANADRGAAKVVTPLSSPSSYVELSFTANAGTPYHLWMRGKAAGDSPYNDSVHIQFSGSVTSSGSPIYRIGTTSSTEYNLEDCLGCGLSGWGWQDNGWGVGVLGPDIYFQTSGTQTIRIQEREDGLSIDQIVLSPSNYRTRAPGALKNDGMILTAQGAASGSPPPPSGSGDDIVMWASNVPSSNLHGSWFRESNATAAGQVALRNPDAGAAKISTAAASPANYFEVTFTANAGTAYRLWIRGRADGDYWGNDSVFVQFSGSVTSTGSAIYRTGTTSALEVNLEDCSGCGLSGWGWQDDGWGVGVLGPLVYFQTSGTQTLRVQTREDGFSIDQLILSPSNYLVNAPGVLKNDSVIVPYNQGSNVVAANQPPNVSISASPTSGTAPLFVNFTSNASDPDGNIASYYWNFGDSTDSTAASPSHTYSAGSYRAYLTVTDNSGATAQTSVQINVSSSQTTSSTLKVLSWNQQFGEGTDGVTNWNRTTTYIANFNPDIVGLCEVPPYDVSTIVNYLNQKTGRSWSYFWVAKAPGIEEGNLILSKYSFVSTSSKYLSYTRSVAQATINVGGRNVNFFATHLDDASSSNRYQEVTEMQSFMSGFAEPRIAVGDFNGGPDQPEAIHMAEQYYDTWMTALNAGTAASYPDNPPQWQTRTRRGRIDYVWLSKGSNAVIDSTQIPDVRDLSNTNVVILLGTTDDKGVRPSDHNPMIANIRLP